MSLRRTLLLIGILFPLCLTAQEKFLATKWEIKDGRSSNFANSIIKDTYGFTWIGHRGGVDRFDGIQFKEYNIDGGFGLVEDSLHNIWLGTADGLRRMDASRDTSVKVMSSIQTASGNHFVVPFWATQNEMYCIENASKVTAYDIRTLARRILVDTFQNVEGQDLFRYHFSILNPDGKLVWMVDRGGLTELSLVTGKQEYYPPPGKTPNQIHDAGGMCWNPKTRRIWINSTAGLLEFDPMQKRFITAYTLEPAHDVFPGISVAGDGKIWFALGMPLGIQIYDPATSTSTPVFSDYELQEAVSADNMVLYCDRDSIAWAGKWSNKGLYQINPASQVVQRYATDENSTDFIGFNGVETVSMVSSGRLWFATGMGVREFDPVTRLFTTPPKKVSSCFGTQWVISLVTDTVVQKAWAMLPFPVRVLEVDLQTGLCMELPWKDMENRTIQMPAVLDGSVIHFRQGALILVPGYGIFRVSARERVAKQIIKFEDEVVTAISTDDEKYLFARKYGQDRNTTYLFDNDRWEKVNSPLDGVPWFCIYFNQDDHTYWVGGAEFIGRYSSDFKPISIWDKTKELRSIHILSLLPDKAGNVWFNSGKGGLFVWDVRAQRLITISEKEGYQGQLFQWNNPRIRDRQGNLYFVGDDGIDRINPLKLVKHHIPSQVYFQSIMINENGYSPVEGINEIRELDLEYNQNNVTVGTGIIDYYSKGKSGIRYRLEGLNDNWQYGSNQYRINYNSLPPNHYRLIVQASNVLGEFNGPERTLEIQIRPPYWETWWFRTGSIITFVFLIYAIYLWRTASLRKQKRMLEQTVKERTLEVVNEKAEVERQKEKSDELLLNILPAEVAEELKEKGYTTARSFDQVSILFSDIKGFTQVSEKLSAQELVQEINTYFSAFDQIMQQHGLEKIKTIGDAYIAAGGLPEGNTADACKVVQAAIAMQKVTADFGKTRAAAGRPYFELRIGIHTGSVVAGVVGIKKFQYDIWGDAVNLAARMEQSGMAGKINISHDTYELIKNHFQCTHRGKVEAKNKGEMDMYFVDRAIA